jgi:hypothetical protein
MTSLPKECSQWKVWYGEFKFVHTYMQWPSTIDREVSRTLPRDVTTVKTEVTT